MAEERRTPSDEVRRLYEEAETRTARAMEDLVGRDSFGELLSRMTENVVALTRLSSWPTSSRSATASARGRPSETAAGRPGRPGRAGRRGRGVPPPRRSRRR